MSNSKTRAIWERGRLTSTLSVPGGGLVFPSFMLNHSYDETDVFISIAKMKEHVTGGRHTVAQKQLWHRTAESLWQ